jgi:hypothetical protein
MANKESSALLTEGSVKSSLDLEEYDSESESPEVFSRKDEKKHRLRKQRNAIFLMVNLFVLLLNIGVLLMMIVPDSARSEGMDDHHQMIPYPRYDHQG